MNLPSSGILATSSFRPAPEASRTSCQIFTRPSTLAHYVDSAVDLLLEEGKLVIVPAVAPGYALESLLADVTVENLHDEVDTGVAVGSEAW